MEFIALGGLPYSSAPSAIDSVSPAALRRTTGMDRKGDAAPLLTIMLVDS